MPPVWMSVKIGLDVTFWVMDKDMMDVHRVLDRIPYKL